MPAWADGADRFAAEARAEEAVERRRRERWDRQQRQVLTTLPAALDAALGSSVTLLLRDGSTLPGTVVDLGADHLELRATTATHWVALAAVVGIESERAFVADPEDLPLRGARLVEVLEDLVAEEGDVTVRLTGGTVVRGQVIAAGEALTMRPTDRPSTVLLSLEAIEVVSVAGRSV
jgi:small nuclear ribonucleoprotein (snRNP)-like protein